MKKKKNWIFAAFVLLLMICTVVTIFSYVHSLKPQNIEIFLYNSATKQQKSMDIRAGYIYDKLTHDNVEGYEFVDYFYDSEYTKRIDESTLIDSPHTIYCLYQKIIYKDSRNINVDGQSDVKIISSQSTPISDEELRYLVGSPLRTLDLSQCYYADTTLPENTFLGKNFKEIKLFANIKTIGAGAFKNCYNLYLLSLPASLETIEDQAFYNCTKLNNLTLPDSINTIKSKVFAFMQLENLTLPNNLREIENDTFENLIVKNITNNSQNQHFKIQNGVLYGNNGTEILHNFDMATTLVIDENVSHIVNRAFAGSKNLRRLTIASSSLIIDEEAFVNSSLEYIDLSRAASVSIGNYAFSQSMITSLQLGQNIDEIGDSAFRDCKKLTTANLYDLNLDSLPNDLFSGCTKLSEITLPETVKRVGDRAFKDCYALESVELPESLAEIGDSCFNSCLSLSSVTGGAVTKIGSSAFEACRKLSNIVFAQSCETLGRAAFKGCESILLINLKELTRVEEETFAGCTNLQSTLFNKLEFIGASAFASCQSLESFSIISSLNQIENGAFASCQSLYMFTGDNDAYSCLDGVLYNYQKSAIICYPLCKNDENFTILSSVLNIYDDGLMLNPYLKNITVDPLNPSFSDESGVLFNQDKTTLICYPSGHEQGSGSYRTPEEVTKIGDKAFYAAKLSSLTITNNVEYIGESALAGVENLSSLTLPFIGQDESSQGYLGYLFGADGFYENLEKIPSFLTSITITKQTHIDKNCFYEAENITSINYSGDVDYIGSGAFNNTSELRRLTIGGELKKIESGAFNGLTRLSILEFKYSAELSIEADGFKNMPYRVEVRVNNCPSGAITEVIKKFTDVISYAQRWTWPQ